MKTIQTILCGSLAVLALAACSSDDNDIIIGEQNPTEANQTWTVTTEATMGDDEANGGSSRVITRALSEDGTAINATFATTEHVYVYNASNTYTQLGGSLQPQADGISATLKGTLTGTIANGNSLKLVYPKSAISYTGQKGTLADIAANYDFATATVTVSDASTPSVTTTAATFTSQQAITKFTFSTAVKSLTISGTGLVQSIAANGTETTGDIDVTLATASTTVYVAMRNNSGSKQTYTFTATDASGNTYTATKKAKLENGKNYAASVTLLPDALSGKFTINSSGKKVHFSRGNLRYADSKWSFFDHQYDYYTSYSASAWDKFGWSTSATDYGKNTSTTQSDYSGDFVDWGNAMTGWKTLSKNEWVYIFEERSSGSTVNGTKNARYTEATINTDGTSVKGIILFPDGVTIASSGATTWDTVNGFSSFGTKCTSAQWTALEAKGCVFLPAAGERYGSSISEAGSRGYYWSSTPGTTNTNYVYYVYFLGYKVDPDVLSSARTIGCSVRLVRDAE